MLFLVHQVACKPQSRADVLDCQVVFALHFLEGHPPARLPTTIATGVRVPRITGLPWHMFGSTTIRSSITLTSVRDGCVLRKSLRRGPRSQSVVAEAADALGLPCPDP